MPAATRATDVVRHMHRDEKLAMVHGVAISLATTPGYAGTVAGVTRLCIPPLHLADGPAGVGDLMSGATQLPAPVALASTWDPSLAGRYGGVIGAEAAGKGVGVALAPTVNIVRDPRWGRAFESLGEDPYLTSQVAAAEIDGIQARRVIAQVKHFAVYNQETNRDTASDDAHVDDRTLREIYLPAFQAAVQRAHVGSVMCAYSTVNGTPACANADLLDRILKQEWNFPGFVTSDWYANLPGSRAAVAGLDMQMPDGCLFGPALGDAVAAGRVPVATLDDMVRRILTQMFSAGLVDHPGAGTPATKVTTAAHVALAREVATEGMVLLRNAGILPLESTRLRTIAVIGAARSQSFHVGGGSAIVLSSAVVSPLEGITERAGKGVRVVYDDGSDGRRAASVARAADAAVVLVGRNDSEFHDHTTLDLDAASNALVDAVAAANHDTVVVLSTGSAVTMPWVSRVGAVLESWYPGQEDGHALAAVLFGDANPSGKLAVTFPAALADVPTATPGQWPVAGSVQYAERLLVGYRSYDARDVAPLFPFGFGLSYTTFSFDKLHVTRRTHSGRIEVSVDVTNTGPRAGADVVQLYVGDPTSTGEPPRQLRGFRRVELAAGRRTRVRFELGADALAHWDTRAHRWVAPAGRYRVLVGDSSAHLPLQASSELTRAWRGRRAAAWARPAPSTTGDAADRKRCPLDFAVPVGNAALSTPVTP